MTFNRRQFTQATAALVAAGATPLAFAADTLKIGYVSPQTGPLAPFGEADKWVIDQMKAAFKDGIAVGGRSVRVTRDRRATAARGVIPSPAVLRAWLAQVAA